MPSAGEHCKRRSQIRFAVAASLHAFPSLGRMLRRERHETPRRRQFLQLAAGVLALPAVSRIAKAQAYPARPVRLLIGFAAGGTQDVIGRLLGQWLSARPADHHRESAGRRQQHRRRGCAEVAARRPHTFHGRSEQRDQRLCL
jgi:hypothetical protein